MEVYGDGSDGSTSSTSSTSSIPPLARLVLEHASWHTHRRRLGFEIGDFGVEILETLSKARNNVFSYVFIFYNVTNVTELQYL